MLKIELPYPTHSAGRKVFEYETDWYSRTVRIGSFIHSVILY